MQVFNDPVQFAKGVKLKDLLSGSAEFTIDAEFMNPTEGSKKINDLLADGDDSDTDDVCKEIEPQVETWSLTRPEYRSFDDLASKMVDCVPSGTVKMHIIEEGDGPLIPPDAMLVLHYTAYFENEPQAFDSSLTSNFGKPSKILLGKGRYLPGLEIGLTCVKGPSARLLLLLAPEMCYGAMGVLPRIKPERALFVVEVLDVVDAQAGQRYNDLPIDEQKKFEVAVETVKSIHSEAKRLFQKRKYRKALSNYQQTTLILKTCQSTNEYEEREISKLTIKSYTNLVTCYYKMNKPEQIIHMCNCLEKFCIDLNKSCKLLFYYAKANEMLNRYEEATKYYKLALKLEPKNTEIGEALAKIDEYNKKSAVKMIEVWKEAFQCSSVIEEKKNYVVDSEFQDGVREMCQNLAGSPEYAKFDLPPGLLSDEIECIKDMCSKFESIVVLEDGEGKRKKVSIVKKAG